MERIETSGILFLLVKRTVIFFLLCGVLSAALYVAGALRGVADDTQLKILKVSFVAGLLLLASALFGCVLDSILALRKKSSSLLRGAGAYACAAFLGALLAGFSSLISVFAKGNINE